MSSPTTEAPLTERVASVRRRLATSFTLPSTLAVLSMADTSVLRELETEAGSVPGPVDTLRERVAAWHVNLVRRKVLMSTKGVTAEVMHRWAKECLAEWFTGVTDFDRQAGGQFRIRPIGAQDGQVQFEVVTFSGHDPRRFEISIDVRETPWEPQS